MSDKDKRPRDGFILVKERRTIRQPFIRSDFTEQNIRSHFPRSIHPVAKSFAQVTGYSQTIGNSSIYRPRLIRKLLLQKAQINIDLTSSFNVKAFEELFRASAP